MKKMYQILTLRSGENILDADITIKVFENFNEAKKYFEEEVECVKLDMSENSEIREYKNFVFSFYDDYIAYAVKVVLLEISNKTYAGISF